MNPLQDYIKLETRRQFFGKAAMGLGIPALASLLGTPRLSMASAPVGEFSNMPHFAPKAKRAIYLFMSGAPSQQDMWDYKPKLEGVYKKDLFEELTKANISNSKERITTMTSGQGGFPIAPSRYKFKKYDNGGDGVWVSELLPHTATIVKEIAVIKSMWTEAINHDPAITYIQTGNQIPGKPSLGAWLSYGLGSENENLPTYVVLNSTWSAKRQPQAIFNRLWGSGFLPSQHQGVLLRSQGDPVLYLSNPKGVSGDVRRRMLDSLSELNRSHMGHIGDPETEARISQYEMAFRMQTAVPELVDLSGESKATLDMYGPDVHKPGTFAYNCLLARRLAERGVRCTQIFHRGWDQHFNIPVDLPLQCKDVDQGCAALIKDLKHRGMLEDTLVIWGGEFGRTSYCQGALNNETYGRDHHPRCFTMWMAGAGIKPGIVYGETDDFSYNITRNPVHIRDLNATILERFGIDHRRLSFRYQGIDQKLTGVEEAHVVRDLFV